MTTVELAKLGLTGAETLPELEARLAAAKAEVRDVSRQGLIVAAAGSVAEDILREIAPDADSVTIIAHHEAAHFCVMRKLGLPVAGIKIRKYAGGGLHGLVSPTWEGLASPPGECDATHAGARMADCKGVGVSIDLDDSIEKFRKIAEEEWPKVRRIALHLASLCHT